MIYTHITSPRLQYICSFIFKELMGVDFMITIDSEAFIKFEGTKINYSTTYFQDPDFCIHNNVLLFDEIIVPQEITCFDWNGTKAFFRTPHSAIPFDIFAATFYLLTRYEEYLPHEKDTYGRYAHENSLAFREEFLDMPMINVWVKEFAKQLKERFPSFNPKFPAFKFQPTYDIDIAYSYLHKGLFRNIGGFLKSASAERIKVLAGAKPDPFDSYQWLEHLHSQHDLLPQYFFLVAEKNSRFDKNILPHKEIMWQLVKQHAGKYRIGLHPSWQSGDDFSLLRKEKKLLEAMSETAVTASRQHFIRFNLPITYNRLIEAGFIDDHSMGYGSINGFRASTSSPFYWYNLEKEEQTSLRIHPFCFMDANSFYEQKQGTAETMEELIHYYNICKSVNGPFTSIWHNNFLGTAKAFKGWRELYEQFIIQVLQ